MRRDIIKRDIVFFDDETREVPEHIQHQLALMNEGHFVVVIMDDGSRWDGRVSKTVQNNVATWMVGGRPLFQVNYAPFMVYLVPWNIFAIVNIEDYRDRVN